MADPFDILRMSDPAPVDAQSAYSPEADAILEEVFARVEARASRRRWMLIAAAILTLLVAAAAAWFSSRDLQTMAVTCWESANLDADRHGTVADGVPSVDDCVSAWEDDLLRNEDEPGVAPSLYPCVSDGGGLWVFPASGPEVCSMLGLGVWNEDQVTDEIVALAAVQEDVEPLVDGVCTPLPDAIDQVRAVMDRHGLDHWVLEVSSRVSTDPCTSFAYDLASQKVMIVPIPPLGDDTRPGVTEFADLVLEHTPNVSIGQLPHQPYEDFDATPWLLCIEGRGASLYDFATPQARAAAGDLLANQPARFDDDLLWGSNAWFAYEDLLIVYHHDPDTSDETYDLLDSIAGPPLFEAGYALGDPPEETPKSEYCP